jgi:DNA-binding MarR family transcriptional regulator
MYLRNILGFSKRKSFKVVRVWNLKCDPAQRESELKSSFNSYWRSDYNLLGCQIPDKPDLQQILNSHFNKNACIRITGRIKNNKSFVKDNSTDSFYNNRIIKRIDKLHGTALIIYAVLEKHEEGLTADRLREIIDMSKKHLINRLKELIKLGFVEVKTGNRRRGIKDLYKIKRQGSYGTGRTALSYGAVIAAANSVISPAQYKVYLLLKWYEQIGQSKGVYPSTFTLADKLRLDQSTVQNHITALFKKDFIEVDKSDQGYNIYKLQI